MENDQEIIQDDAQVESNLAQQDETNSIETNKTELVQDYCTDSTSQNDIEFAQDSLKVHNQENKFLGEEKISKLLLKFSIPCIISLLISALYNIVDKVFIGNSELGVPGTAATGVVFPITLIAVAFAWCFGDGTAAFLSICQGKNETENAHKSVGNAMLVSFVISFILMAIFFPLKSQLLYLFGADENTIGLAEDYFVIIVAAFPIYMVSNTLNSVIRADGSPTFAMIAMASGAVTNIIFDPIFIFPCHMGIKGAAWATIMGQAVSFILCIIYLFRTKTFKLSAKSFVPNFKVLGEATKLGISTFITQMSIVAISLTCNSMLKKYGALSPYGSTIPISVISIETTIFTVIINIAVGITLGAQPILGYNYGAKDFERVKRTFLDILIACLVVGGIATILTEACPQALYGIFGKGDALYNEFATKTFRIFLSSIMLTCIIKMSAIFFQSVGSPVKATVISLVRDIVVFIPFVVSLPVALGIEGILWSAPLADAVGILITIPLIIDFFVRFKKLTQAQPLVEC